ncbi:MAG: hypothetical protein A3B11_00755 [Candidatus Taylorbacteria bacterium RIFCSPLOWO2_01_FULL_44_26]|uniref:Uncharacterized protein n=1 Tax=Candidatus Taylorbacteria bacterium RIFCSPLOWO2_01_FULL_44_26 TaxID=1802318 RepID=A0A1G2N7E2_9BACT|nr:MAG: hypothetical protein A3B11_00755 [Candidatus Taylorbacteria bacterium RIFCSPLOWO2_01_FULL_44_26]
MRGIGHESSPAGSARDPDSLAFARSVLRFLVVPPATQKLPEKNLTVFGRVPIKELNWNGILRNIREIKDLLTIVLPEAGIIPDFSTLYA